MTKRPDRHKVLFRAGDTTLEIEQVVRGGTTVASYYTLYRGTLRVDLTEPQALALLSSGRYDLA